MLTLKELGESYLFCGINLTSTKRRYCFHHLVKDWLSQNQNCKNILSIQERKDVVEQNIFASIFYEKLCYIDKRIERMSKFEAPCKILSRHLRPI